jgi:predicted exporter
LIKPTSSLSSLQRRLAWTWLLVVALLLGHNAWLWLVERVTPDTDILALLPSARHDDAVQQAFSHMVDSAQQKVVVLIGAADWQQARQATTAYEAVSASQPQLLQAMSDDASQLQSSWLASFDQSRLLLLSTEQRRQLQQDTPQQWSQQALANLYGSFAGPRLGAWQDDPFGLFSGWVQERAQETPVRPRDGRLYVENGGRSYVLLLMNLQQPAFSLSAQEQTLALLAAAERAAHAVVPDVDIISAGVILHAAAASSQARSEMTTIGAGSLLGILLLMWLGFRSFKPIALIALSIAIGCLGALSVSWLLFGRLHLLTLVFGASLVGIAQDYAIYFLCSRLGSAAHVTSRQLLRQLLPGLGLMLLAAVIGYLGMAATPFPGLRQMAVFSVLGLLFAWLTVLLWFPALIHPDSLRKTALAHAYGNSIRHWPRLNGQRPLLLAGLLLVALLLIASGLSRLHASDDIRALQKTPQHLLNDQIRLSKMLDMPNPAQFYLVRGDTAEQVLQREEQLRQALQPLIGRKLISGVQAVSNWVPSLRQQQANRDLIASKLLDVGTDVTAPLAAIAGAIDENQHWQQAMRQRLLARTTPLLPEDFIDAPASQAWRHLWLGQNAHRYASIVAVRGISDYHQLPTLAALAPGIEGVQWVDKVADISAVLSDYRQYMSGALVVAYAAIFLLLSWRYRSAAWRVIAPPLSATLLTLALFGLIGQPLQLFHVLACLLLLGLGVDYGIFLQEPGPGERAYAWLTVGLSAVSALLSFGLLALSDSPPLHAFGLTMLIGMALIWLLSPCFIASPPTINLTLSSHDKN